jgi:ribonuclease HI
VLADFIVDEDAWIMGNLRRRRNSHSNFTIKIKTCYAARLEFNCTNNIAEYEAVLLGLQKLRAMGIRRAVLKSDLQVITGQVNKSSKARDPKLEKYLDIVRTMEASFEGFLVKISQEETMNLQIY